MAPCKTPDKIFYGKKIGMCLNLAFSIIVLKNADDFSEKFS
jgi:hypothetical protein